MTTLLVFLAGMLVGASVGLVVAAILASGGISDQIESGIDRAHRP